MNTITDEQFERFFCGYLNAALWTTHDNREGSHGEFLDDHFGRESFTSTALVKMMHQCKGFFYANEKDLRDYARQLRSIESPHRVWDCVGHDFWLTVAGHGTGFWDRGLGLLGDRLTKAAKVYSTPHIFVTEEDRLEVEL